MKKALAMILALTLLLCLFAGCTEDPATPTDAPTENNDTSVNNDETQAPSTDGYKIAFTSNYLGNSWRTQYEEAVTTRFEAYKEKGIVSDYTYVACNSDVTEQLNQLNQLLHEDWDLIMVDAVSPSSIASFLEEAEQKGVKVLLGNTITPAEGVPCVSADLGTIYGKAEAYYLAEKLGGKGNVIEIFGVAGQTSCELFEQAAQEVFDKYPDINVLAKGNGYWNDADAQTEMATFLSTYGEDIDAVFCEDGMAYGIINAFLNAGMETVPTGGDYFNSFIQYWYNNQETLDSIMVPNSPYATGTILADCCVYMCDGYTFDETKFVPNQIDPTIENWIALPMPYLVMEEGEMNPDWLSEFPDTKVMSLDEAHALMEGKAETAAIQLYYDDAFVASLFGLDASPYWN